METLEVDKKAQEVYDYLCSHCMGKENMQKNSVVRLALNIKGDKKMRKIIQDIRESSQFPKLVGSHSGNKGGFYICKNREECDDTINNIKHRAGKMYQTCHIMEWKVGMEDES